MILYPALDLREGEVVQLVGGRPEAERLRLQDPLAVARRWWEAGFPCLHVVDLDSAIGLGDGARNRAAIERLLAESPVPVQVGGGIRDEAAAARWLETGAARVIVGTRALRDSEWLETLAARHPQQIVVAADFRGERLVTHGWTEEIETSPEALLRRLEPLPLAAVLMTDVGREGRMEGADVQRFVSLAATSKHPLLVSGGISRTEELLALEAGGVAGAVLGMALYTGALELERWLGEGEGEGEGEGR